MSKERKNCMCTAMLFDPKDHYEPAETSEEFKQNSKLYERFMKLKQSKLMQLFRKKENGGGSADGAKKSFFHYFFNL